MPQVLVAAVLVAYNTIVNRWPSFHGWAYVPTNLAAGAVLVAVARGPLGLGPAPAGLVLDVSDLALGAALGGLGAAPLLALAAAPRFRPFVADRRAADPHPLYRALVRIPLGTALFEEVAFRGVLLGAFLDHGREVAIVASAAAFGLWHVEPARLMARLNHRPVGATVVATVLFTGAVGLLLGALRLSSGGVSLPVGLHAAFNSLAYLAARRALAAHRIASPRS